MASKRFGETNIGFMEKRELVTLQLSCSECHKIVYYVNEENVIRIRQWEERRRETDETFGRRA